MNWDEAAKSDKNCGGPGKLGRGGACGQRCDGGNDKLAGGGGNVSLRDTG